MRAAVLFEILLLLFSLKSVLNVAACEGENPTRQLSKSSSVVSSEIPKHLAAVRRKPGLTGKEYLKYHLLKHGEIAWNTTARPQKYVEDHGFDSVFGTTEGKKEPSYFGRDDITELYSNSVDQFYSFTFNKYTATVIGPDGANFNDFPSTFSMFAYETPITSVLNETWNCDGAKRPDSYYDMPGTATAFYWLKAKTPDPSTVNNATFAQGVVSALLLALEEVGPRAVYAASMHVPVPEYDSRKYYGGTLNPIMNAVIKLWLCDLNGSVDGLRAAQKIIENGPDLKVDFEASFTVFAREITLWDLNQGIHFDAARLSHIIEQETKL